MAKKGVSRITGNTSPKTGEKALYKVTEWYPATPDNERKESLVTWELFRKRPDGKFTSTNIKKKVGEFTFGKDAWQYTYRVEGYLDKPEGKDPMSIIVQPQKNEQQPSAEKNILDVKLTFQDGTPVNKKLSYQDRLWAIAKCKGLEGEHIIFTLWEDDEKGDGHNKKNQSIVKSPPVLVDSQGNARWNFALLSTYIAIANQREDDKKQHEYYVTAEYNGKLKASDNANANNPEYKAPPTPTKKPSGGTGGTSQPKPAPPKPQPNSPKGSTRPNSPNNQPDKKGEITLVKLTDKNGKEFTKNPKFGETIIVHIESKNLKGKKYTLKIWEHDTIGKDDLLYSHEHTFLGDKINLSMPLTAAMQKTGEIGNDPKNPDSGEYYWKGGQQEIFAEVIYIDISAKSKIIDVDILETPKPQNNGNTATGVKNEPKPETKTGGCPNCDKPVTADDLKTIFPNASEANRKIVADTYTKYMKDLGMNTCWNKAHFFAQAKIESGDALSLKEGEGFNYYWEALIGKFGAFKTKEGKEKAKLWGRAIRDRKDPKAVDVPKETQIKIANYAYSPPAAKAKVLENTEPNDGWNYRGRGLIQVTGKGFYKYCNPYTLKYNNIDVLKNPDAIGERIDLSVSSGMIFFKWKGINKLSNTTKDVEGKICPLVGSDVEKTVGNKKSTNYKEKQKAFTDITSVVFKIDSCKFGKGEEPKKQKGKYTTYDSKYTADDTTIYIDIIVPSDRKKEGLLVFFDNTGILHKCYVLGLGTGGEDRYTNGGYGNVPNGLWKTKQELNVPNANGQPYPNTGVSFGNHGTIRLSPKAGDALNASNRSGILLHCGHTIGDGKKGLTDNGALMVTHGCLRVYNKDMPIIQKIYTEQAKKGKTIYIYVEETADLKAMFTNYATVPDPKDTVIRKNKKYDPQ